GYRSLHHIRSACAVGCPVGDAARRVEQATHAGVEDVGGRQDVPGQQDQARTLVECGEQCADVIGGHLLVVCAPSLRHLAVPREHCLQAPMQLRRELLVTCGAGDELERGQCEA